MYKKKKIIWNERAVKALLEVWGKNLSNLRGSRRNGHILLEMLNELKAQGYAFTAVELKTKMHNLTTRYRREKRKIKTSDGSSSEWDLYNDIDLLFSSCKNYDSEGLVFDNINSISCSIVTDPLSPSMSLSSPLPSPSKLEYSAPPSPSKPPESPLASTSSESPSPNTSPAATRKRKKFDKFFENLEKSIEKINEDITTTIEKMISIEEEKKEILKNYVEREGEVQEALLEFLKRT